MRKIEPIRISGLGIATSLGFSLDEIQSAILKGKCVTGKPFSFFKNTPYKQYLAAPALNLNLEAQITDRRMLKFMSPHAELAAVVASQAISEAGLNERKINPARIGLYAGVGLAAVDIFSSRDFLSASLDKDGAFNLEKFSRTGLGGINPLWSFHTLANMPACIVSILSGIKGDNGIYSPWEDQSAFALLEAAEALGRSDIDVAVVLAADTPSHPASLVELASAGYLNENEIAAAGAACLVLERADALPPQMRPFSLLSGLKLEAAPIGQPINDPLAPLIGRTVAAAPLLLMALAPQLGLPFCLCGCGGHSFSFEVT